MEEPLPVLDSPPEAPPPPAISLAARLLNVFAIPGEVFAGVRASRISIGNWLVPTLLLVVVGAGLYFATRPGAKPVTQAAPQPAEAPSPIRAA